MTQTTDREGYLSWLCPRLPSGRLCLPPPRTAGHANISCYPHEDGVQPRRHKHSEGATPPLTHLHFEQPAAVRLEVTVVNLAHGVHVLVSDLLGDRSLIGQKELVEEPAVKTTTASISFFTLCPVISNAQLKTSSTQQKNNKQTVKRWVELPGQETEGGNVTSASDVAVTTSTFKFKNSPQIKLTQTCAQTYQQSNISNNSNQ